MIARMWRTRIDERRADEYLDFARSRSLPMFRGHEGFIGAVFGAHHAERAVITLWRDLGVAHALDDSQVYRATVAQIEATGFIVGPSAIDIFEVEEIFVDQVALDRAVGQVG